MPQNDSIIIADLQSHTVGGHFATWFNRTIEEAEKSFDKITVYVADKLSFPHNKIIKKLGPRLSVFEIEPIWNSGKKYGDILGIIHDHNVSKGFGNRKTPIFVMWAQQHLDRDKLYPRFKKPFFWNKESKFNGNWGTLFSAGSLAYEGADKHDLEVRSHAFTHQDHSCKGVFLWDSYAVNALKGKYIYLPDVEEIDTHKTWNLPAGEQMTIGSVGQLWGYRSINLIGEIHSREINLKVYLGGVLKKESYNNLALEMIKREDANFTLEEGFVENDEELNERLSKLDAFVIDSRTYKYPSGLAIRAMAMGRPLVTVDSASWAYNLVKDEGVGIFWRPGQSNLNDDLKNWFKTGGSNRSKKLASNLNDRNGMQIAYKKMFSRLV
jgi:glycosyltransferase involved in cell wall biosynthesis